MALFAVHDPALDWSGWNKVEGQCLRPWTSQVVRVRTTSALIRPLDQHVEECLEHLSRKRIRGRKVSALYLKNIRGWLTRLIADCGWRRLRDITRKRMER